MVLYLPVEKNKQNKKQNCGVVFQRDGINAWQHRINSNVRCQETYSINAQPFLVNIQSKFCFSFPFSPNGLNRRKWAQISLWYHISSIITKGQLSYSLPFLIFQGFIAYQITSGRKLLWYFSAWCSNACGIYIVLNFI